MIKKNWKLKIIGSILLFLFIFSSFSLFFSPQTNNNLLKGESIENLEELKLSSTDWTTTEVVSILSSNASELPTIAVDSVGNAHVAWQDITNNDGAGLDWDIFYKRRSSTSNAWTPTEVVSTESDGDSNYPTIAVDDDGNVHVAWQDISNNSETSPFWDIFYKRWNATISTWTMTEVVTSQSTANSLYPTIAADNLGNVNVAWQDRSDYNGADADWDIFYRQWNTTSRAWTTTEVVSTESDWDSEFPTIAVDDVRNVHIAWHDSTNYASAGSDVDIFYKRWNSTSSSWTITEVVSTQSDSESYSPTIAVNGTFYPTINWPATGNVYVAWYDHSIYDVADLGSDIFYKLWNATTNLWTTTEVISIESAGDSYIPTIAVDSFMNVHIAWFDVITIGGVVLDVYYKLWNATSSMWTTAEMVSTESDGHSITPTIAVEGGGNAHIAWDDITNYQTSETDHDIFYKQSNPLLSGPGAPGIPGYNIFLLIGIICVVSVILFKKLKKNKL